MPALSCPSCRQSFLVSRDEVGGAVACPHCQQRLTLQRRKRRDWQTQPPPVARPAPTPEDAPLSYEPSESFTFDPSPPFPLRTALGMTSLVASGLALLTLLLPLYGWFALPIAGLGAALGLIGLLTSWGNRRQGLGLTVAGTAVGAVLTAILAFAAIDTQLKIERSAREAERSLQRLEQELDRFGY